MIQRKIQSPTPNDENKGEGRGKSSSSKRRGADYNVLLGRVGSLLAVGSSWKTWTLSFVSSSSDSNNNSYSNRAAVVAATVTISRICISSAVFLAIIYWTLLSSPGTTAAHLEDESILLAPHSHRTFLVNIQPDTHNNSTTTTENEDKRPSGKFSKTWNLTVEQQLWLQPLASVFNAAGATTTYWHAFHGLACQQATFEHVALLVDYLSALDLYIVSHGGVGSNALVDHFDQRSSLNVKRSRSINNMTRTKSNQTTKNNISKFYDYSCHLGNPVLVGLVRGQQQQQQQQSKLLLPPTLVIVGDFWNAFCSMKRRGWLNMNIAKNLYASQYCRTPWQNNLSIFPTDPTGIKSMMLSHIFVAKRTKRATETALPSSSSQPPIVFLQAPYTSESIAQALELLLLVSSAASSSSNGTNDNDVLKHIQGFEVRPRHQYYYYAHDNNNSSAEAGNMSRSKYENDDLQALYKPYIKLEEILSLMPRSWNAADTPRELYDYLLAEFQKEQ